MNAWTTPPPSRLASLVAVLNTLSLGRLFRSSQMKLRFMKSAAKKFLKTKGGELVKDVFTLVALTGVGGAVIGTIEGWSFVECIYFAVQSMTSVGYGDVGPQTLAGQILTILYLPFSLWFMNVFLGLVAQLYVSCHRWNINRIVKRRKKELDVFNDLEVRRSPRCQFRCYF